METTNKKSLRLMKKITLDFVAMPHMKIIYKKTFNGGTVDEIIIAIYVRLIIITNLDNVLGR